MTLAAESDHDTSPTVITNTFAMSYGCKTPDGQHIYGHNGRCLMCWRMNDNTDQASRLLVIVITAESSDCERVNQLAEIVEAQVRGIFNAVALLKDENRHRNPLIKSLEMEVCAS